MIKKYKSKNGISSPLGLIIVLFIFLILVIIMVPYLYNIMIDVNQSTNYDMALFKIDYTDNGNVIIIHQKGPSINHENIEIQIDGKPTEKQFKSTITQGDSIAIMNKDFDGGEQIDIVANDNVIARKIVPNPPN